MSYIRDFVSKDTPQKVGKKQSRLEKNHLPTPPPAKKKKQIRV